MQPINATLNVEAPADVIWALITHFAKYGEWNRLVPTLGGEAQLNARLKLSLAPAGRRPIVLKARVLVAARNRELRWCGRTRLPKLLKVEHGFRVEQRAGGCRIFHTLACSGWLANERLETGLREAFEATNTELTARAGAIVAAQVPEPIVALPVRPLAPRPPVSSLRYEVRVR